MNGTYPTVYNMTIACRLDVLLMYAENASDMDEKLIQLYHRGILGNIGMID